MSLQKHTVLACGAAATWIAAGAHAGLITGETPGGAPDLYGDFVVDLSGLVVYGDEGDPWNPLMDLTDGDDQEGYISEYVLLSGVMWDFNIETTGGVWLSDLRVSITVNAGSDYEEQVLIAPTLGDDFEGQGAYSSNGWIDLAALGMSMFVGCDDTIRVELFNAFFPPIGESEFSQGSTLTLGLQIPGPGAVPMLVLGGLMSARRRR